MSGGPYSTEIAWRGSPTTDDGTAVTSSAGRPVVRVPLAHGQWLVRCATCQWEYTATDGTVDETARQVGLHHVCPPVVAGREMGL